MKKILLHSQSHANKKSTLMGKRCSSLLACLGFSVLALGFDQVIPRTAAAAGLGESGAPEASAGASTPAANSATSQTPGSAGKRVGVDSLKKKYWIPGAGLDPQVVQFRKFTKSLKVSIDGFYSTFSADPFLNYTVFGGSLGFYLNEIIGFHSLYWAMNSNYNQSETNLAATVHSDTNQMSSLLGGEVSLSLLYGKLSIFGASVIYFDFFLLGGAGLLNYSSGAPSVSAKYGTVAFWPGLGEQFYLTSWLALKADVRFMLYQENVISYTSGVILKNQLSLAPAISVGFNILLPP